MPALQGNVVAVPALTVEQRDQMYAVFSRYYDDISREGFEADLTAKDDVIMLRDRDGFIRGFSTLQHMIANLNGKQHRAVFSGDTVVDRVFWGSKVLGRVFLRYMLATQLRRPWSPLWWFLISKGYKTYLLMANNFPEHWPRYERATPKDKQALLNALANQMFPEYFNAERGLVDLPGKSGYLRTGIATVNDELIAKNPRVRFFMDHNPDWAQGVELACIARMDCTMPIRYAYKALAARGKRITKWSRLLGGTR